MKTTLYFRILVALVAMSAIACDPDPIEPLITTTPNPPAQPSYSEYQTSVTTWVKGDDGRFMGLVTQTPPDTDLSTVTVFVVRNGKRMSVEKELDATSVMESQAMYGEYFWFSHKNNVLLLNYIGQTVESPPPFPLDVIIVY